MSQPDVNEDYRNAYDVDDEVCLMRVLAEELTAQNLEAHKADIIKSANRALKSWKSFTLSAWWVDEKKGAPNLIEAILDMVESERSEWELQGRPECAHVAEMIRDNIQHFWGNAILAVGHQASIAHMSEWETIDTAPEGVEVMTKIDDQHGERNVTSLVKRTRIPGETRPLFWTPDGSMYVYYEPTHWRPHPKA